MSQGAVRNSYKRFKGFSVKRIEPSMRKGWTTIGAGMKGLQTFKQNVLIYSSAP